MTPHADTTQLCGILLHPAGHTLSPVLHARAYEELRLDARYAVFDVRPERLAASFAELRARPFRQLSVSLPHKEAVLALADRVSDAARSIGAVNTLTLSRGQIEADNTDWLGVVRSLEPHGPWKGRTALVVGAGGAARAVVYALRQLGCRVLLTNRTAARAERLARELGAEPGSLEDPYDLLVNATSVGMQPESAGTPVPRAHLRPGTVVFDLVYAPLETRLLREARQSGCTVQDGLDMLVHQAAEQVRLWSGKTPSPAALRRSAEEALADRARRA